MESGIKFIASMANQPKSFLDNDKVKKFQGYFKNTAWSFIWVFSLFHLVKISSIYWMKNDSTLFKRMIVKLIVTATMSTGYTWAINELTRVANATTTGFASGNSLLLLLSLVFSILVLTVAFQVAIRAAELAFLLITGPFVIATNLNDDFNLFPVWWRSVLSILLTQVLQIMLLVITINVFWDIKITSLESMNGFIWGMGMMIITIKGPSYIKEYLYSTGAGQATIGMAAKTGGAIGKQIIRKVTIKK